MPTLIQKPHVIVAEGNQPILIEEYIGRVNTLTPSVSIVRVLSPAGRVEIGKTPEYSEYSVVLTGALRVESHEGVVDVGVGQAIMVNKGEWVRYSTPDEAEYISVCLPAFAPKMMNRDME
jgi:mannose-6-phosphate isomerase-like protein (cupin superfamily)